MHSLISLPAYAGLFLAAFGDLATSAAVNSATTTPAKAVLPTINVDFSVFPQIWVAAGVVDCGQQLRPEPCNIQRATGAATQTTAYPSATVIHTHLTGTAGTPVSTQNARAVRRRDNSIGNNSCGVQLPASFSSNSVNEVCRFVGNNQDRFVSLTPLPAAYMPSWPDYLISSVFMSLFLFQILSAARTFGTYETREFETGFKGRMKGGLHSAKAIFVNTLVTVMALTRTVVGVCEVIKYRNAMDSLPFISPFLWLDWVAAAGIVWQFQRLGKARYIPQAIALAVFGMNTWLMIGYVILSYSTSQYNTIDIPALCQATAASFVTDPRRPHFVRLHIVLYTFGLIAFVVMGIVAIRSKQGKFETPVWRLGVLLTLVGCVVFPSLTGVILSAVLNRNDILLVSCSGDCYASVVSGRFGYFTVDYYDWTQRLGEWFGINV